MKIVRMTCDMRPFQKGADAVLPDDLAQKLVASGEAENPRPFPPQEVAVGIRKREYLTRDKKPANTAAR